MSIAKIVPIGLLERRFGRLRAKILKSRRPIVWLRALPGTGKSRFLASLEAEGKRPDFADWLVIDGQAPEALEAGLAAAGVVKGRPERRVIIASSASEEFSRVMLTPSAYGLVELIEDADFFLTPADSYPPDAHVPDADGLFASTGGWPVLVDAWASGRSAEIRKILPDFLEREVLPNLPQSLVTALFGAVTAPLTPAAVEHLFGAGASLHPLLRATDAGIAVAGEWVRAALLALRAKPRALPRGVLDDLIRIHTAFGDPVASILSLIDMGQSEQAAEVFDRAGGMFFGYRHGYQALETVLRSFGPEWERRRETLFLAHLWVLIKRGQMREADLRLEAKYPGLPVDLRRHRSVDAPYAVLLRLDISLDIDGTPPLEVITSWGRLEALFPAEDDLVRGLLYNTMAIGYLQAGSLYRAKQLAQEALAAYERAKSPYLVHFMLLHLCDLALRQSRLRDASEHLFRAEEALRESALAFNSEPAIIEAFRARIAYEEGRFSECPIDIDATLQELLRGDSWSDLIWAMAGHVAFTAFWRQGLRAALDRLDHCAFTLTRRHGLSQHHGLLLIRVRLYQAARRYVEADARLEQYDAAQPARRSPQLEMDEKLIRLRRQIAQQRTADGPLQAADVLAGLPDLDARQKISIAILQAYLRHRSGEEGLARRHLRAALHHAEADNLLGVLVEEGQFLERLLPDFIADSAGANALLKPFARRVLRLLHTLPTAPMIAKTIAGVSRQEHRVLCCLADGHTNKEIARALNLSEAAVKFHLGNLFRKVKVESRSSLLETARRRGIIT